MSDKKKTIENLGRRHFLRNSAVTGVAGAGLAGGFGAGTLLGGSGKAQAAGESGIEVAAETIAGE